MAAFNFSDLPVTQLRLVDAIASTGTGQTITFEWDEGDTGPFKQVDNTPANDTLLTEIPYVASARLGTTKREGMWFTSGTSNYLVDGIRQATYTLSVRGILNSNTSNPPTTSNTRNYRSHLAQSVGVCGESWLLKNLETTFSAATTDETVTAGEALDTTSAALGVSLHTDGKYYKYHQTNYPNLQGVVEKGQNLALDDSFTLKNLKGSSVLNTGLTAGALYYVQDGGTLTTTFASGVAFLGKAKNTTQIDHALQFNASAMSDAEVTAGTDTDPQLISAAQAKLAAETHGKSYPSSIYRVSDQTLTNATVLTFTHNLGLAQADVEDGKYLLVVWANSQQVFFNLSNQSKYFGHSWSATDPATNSQVRWQENTVKIYGSGETGATINIIQMFE